ncbi:hypothetical protein, partial [Kitasatospora nipponensis]
MYTGLATIVAARIHNPGIQARAVLNSVFVDVTPEDDRTVKIAFGDSFEQGRVRVDLTLLDARKARLDMVTGIFPADQAAGGAYGALFD